MTSSANSVFEIVSAIAEALGESIDRSHMAENSVAATAHASSSSRSLLDYVTEQCGCLGISIHLANKDQLVDVIETIREGHPIVVVREPYDYHVLSRISGGRIDSTRVHLSENDLPIVKRGTIAKRDLNRLLKQPEAKVLIARSDLECQSLTSDAHSHGGHDSHHISPVRRFIALIKLDLRDVYSVVIFSLVAGILGLATPLAIESLVNVVSWGTYLQPLIILALMLLVCLGFAGVLRIIQSILVEIVQRRQLVRLVGDLAHRFPRAEPKQMEGKFPREFANRIFDILTIQKSTAILLMDGLSVILTTAVGLVLLAFYHPLLLGFDIALVTAMILMTWLLGRGGISTAVVESKTKYEIIHWLQDVLDSPETFKLNGGEALAIDRSSRLASDYVDARQRQFRVVLRQITFAVLLQVAASTVLLGLGGWLVTQGQLTLGQLVASELVVTTVLVAFAKLGKSLEKFYDLMAAVDKVGYLLDLHTDQPAIIDVHAEQVNGIRWSDLKLEYGTLSLDVPRNEIAPKTAIAVVNDDPAKTTLFLRAMAGLVKPESGLVEIDQIDALNYAHAHNQDAVIYVGNIEIFHGTVRENVDLARAGIGRSRVRDALDSVGLWEAVNHLHDGLRTQLQTGGYPLTKSEAAQVMIARGLAVQPRLLIIDGLLDNLSLSARESVLQTLLDEQRDWTVVVGTNRPEIAERFQDQLHLSDSNPVS